MNPRWNEIAINWSLSNDRWIIVGGGLPQGTTWASFEKYTDAEIKARVIAKNLRAKFIGVH